MLEWKGWKIPGKLSYCAFLLHVGLIRVAAGSLKTLVPLNNLRMVRNLFIPVYPFKVMILLALSCLLVCVGLIQSPLLLLLQIFSFF